MLSTRTTAWLLVSLILACGTLWLIRNHIPRDGGSPRSRLLIKTDINLFEQLEIEVADQAFTCHKRQDTWWVTHPIETRADSRRINQMLNMLAAAPVIDVISPEAQRRNHTSPRDYGLVPPRARLLLRGSSVQPVELRFGTVAGHGESLYASFTGSTHVWVTNPELADVLPRNIGELRDRTLLPYPVSQLRRFEIRSSGQPILAAEREASGDWSLRQPSVRRADHEAVTALLDYIASAEILSFVDSPATGGSSDPDTLGITYGCTASESPTMARFWFGNGRGNYELHALTFGHHPADDASRIYVLSNEERLVVTVESALERALRVGIEDLRSRQLWPLVPDKITHLRIRGEDAIALAKDAGQTWSIVQPVSAPASQSAVNRLIDALVTAQDLAVADTPPPPRHDWLLALTSAGNGTGVQTALVSRVVSQELGKESFDWYFPALGETRSTETTVLPADFGTGSFFASLRSPLILALPPGSLTAYSQQSGSNVAVRVIRNDKQGWAFESRTETVPDLEALKAVEQLAGELKALRVAALVPPSLEEYGLREPAASFSFEFTDAAGQSVTRTLVLGSVTDAAGYYAWVRGHDSVFVISNETATTLLRQLTGTDQSDAQSD